MATITLTLRHTGNSSVKSAEFSDGTRTRTLDEVPVDTITRSIVHLAQAGFTSHVTEDNAFVLTSPEVDEESVDRAFNLMDVLFGALNEARALADEDPDESAA